MFINLKPKKQDEVEKELIIMFAKERNKTIEQQKEIERLNNIIKEVREKLQNELDNHNVTMGRALKIELLEILDKGDK